MLDHNCSLALIASIV